MSYQKLENYEEKICTIAMYYFIRLPDDLTELRQEVKQKCLSWGFKGTILLAPEGINCFLFGETEKLKEFKLWITERFKIDPDYKVNPCFKSPFSRMLVKIKKEIISMGIPQINPEVKTAPRVSAQELKQWLDEGQPVVLLDTRNTYEIAMGTFENAVEIGVNHFRTFPEAVKGLPETMKEAKVVTFCTGGIRCEKAAAYMMTEGFQDVYQLDGGILRYFEECKGAHYQGDCFVFDWRLGVSPDLKPTSANPRPDSGWKEP